MLKHIAISSLFVASSIMTVVHKAHAENLVTGAVDESNGVVYQVDLDDRSEYETGSGWRHVRFWLATKGDPKKHRSVASCAPYDVKSEYYGWNWRPNGGGYPEGTIAGNIARVACND
jgi:hypothetical protein